MEKKNNLGRRDELTTRLCPRVDHVALMLGKRKRIESVQRGGEEDGQDVFDRRGLLRGRGRLACQQRGRVA